jgi:hypothetical protein
MVKEGQARRAARGTEKGDQGDSLLDFDGSLLWLEKKLKEGLRCQRPVIFIAQMAVSILY